MKGQIAKTAHIVRDDADRFYENLMERIDEYQRAGLIVETQYRTDITIGGKIVYSVLIHGRKV